MSLSTQTTVQSEDRLDMKKILPVFIIILIDLLGLTIIIPLMSLYAVSFGASASVIGLLGAARIPEVEQVDSVDAAVDRVAAIALGL